MLYSFFHAFAQLQGKTSGKFNHGSSGNAEGSLLLCSGEMWLLVSLCWLNSPFILLWPQHPKPPGMSGPQGPHPRRRPPRELTSLCKRPLLGRIAPMGSVVQARRRRVAVQAVIEQRKHPTWVLKGADSDPHDNFTVQGSYASRGDPNTWS